MLKAREISDMIIPLEKELCRSDLPGRHEAQLLEIDGHLKRENRGENVHPFLHLIY